jgi:hypothetical protein
VAPRQARTAVEPDCVVVESGVCLIRLIVHRIFWQGCYVGGACLRSAKQPTARLAFEPIHPALRVRGRHVRDLPAIAVRADLWLCNQGRKPLRYYPVFRSSVRDRTENFLTRGFPDGVLRGASSCVASATEEPSVSYRELMQPTI